MSQKMPGKESIQEIYPLSPMQEGMFFHALMDGSSSAYFEQLSYRLTGSLNVACVEKSFNELFKRHDVLRSVFAQKTTNRAIQIVLKERNINFYYEDISAQPHQEAILKDFKENDRSNVFNLGKDVLMRIAVFQIKQNEYEFIWSFHHILLDGWCMGILVAEFFQIYTSYIQNKPYQLPKVKPFRNYIDWLERKDKLQAQSYWREYLKAYEKLTGLPRIKSCFREAGHQPEEFFYELTEAQTSALKKIAIENHITFNILVQALWGIILAKFNATRDAVFGTVVSGRPAELEGVESMIGLFINAIPVRISFDQDTRFSDLIKRIQKEALECEEHHYYPLADIQLQSSLKNELIDHMVIYENYPVADQIQQAGATSDDIDLQVSNVSIFEQSNYDFTLVLALKDKLVLRLYYNTHVYEKSFIFYVADLFSDLTDQIIANVDLKVNELNFLINDEPEIEQKNDSPGLTIQQLFEKQVSINPHSNAITVGEESLTYEELNEKSNQLAHYLRDRFGVRPENVISVAMSPSVSMIVAILGVVKSGAAYVLVDMENGREDIPFILDDASVLAVLVDDSKALGTFAAFGHHTCIALHQIWSEISLYKSSNPVELNSPDHLSCLVYSDKDKLKGVVLENRNIIANIQSLNFLGNTAQFGFGQVSSHSGTTSVAIWAALLQGAQLHILSPGQLRDAASLKSELPEHIEVLSLSSLLLEELVRENTSFFARFKYLLIFIEHTATNYINKLRVSCPSLKIFCLHGQMENALISTLYEVEPDNQQAYISLPLGKAASGTFVRILDERKRPVPSGAIGEIYLGGNALARGYWQRENLTAEKFIQADIFEGQPERLFNTGESGRVLLDGNIERITRKQDQSRKTDRLQLNGAVDHTYSQKSDLHQNNKFENLYPLSHTQTGLYLQCVINPEDKVYRVTLYEKIKKDIDIDLWRRTLTGLHQSFSILRSSIVNQGDQVYVGVRKEAPVNFEFVDLSNENISEEGLNKRIGKLSQTTQSLDNELVKHYLVKISPSYYITVLSIHHIIFDGTSSKVFFEALYDIYNNYEKGIEVITVIDHNYGAVLSASMKKFDTDEVLDYWKEKLKGIEPLQSNSYSPVNKFVEDRYFIEEEHLNAIRAYCKKNNISDALYYKSLYGLLIRLYCNAQADFFLREIIGGREQGAEQLIGCFYLAVPVVFQQNIFDHKNDLVSYFQNFRKQKKELGANQFFSIFSQNQILGKDEVQFYFNYQNFFTLSNSGEEHFSHLIVSYGENEIHLSVGNSAEGFRFILNYNERYFNGSSFLKRLAYISKQITQGAEFLEDINFILPEELGELSTSNALNISFPKNQTLHSIFEDQVKRNPAGIAVRFAGKSLTYSELNAQANQLAHCLRSKFDIQPDDLVALLVERSEQMVVGVLGILKSGAAYVPIDPSYPQERISYMLEDTSAKALVLENVADVSAYGLDKTKVVLLDELMLSSFSQENIQSINTPSDLAYIIYTSGSTGQPKGVMVEHGNVVRLLFNEEFQFDFSDKDVWTLFHSICFDFSVWELFGALLYGGTLVVVAKAIAQDPDKFADLLEEEQVTVLNQIPTMFNNLVSEVLSRSESDLKLRYVIFGGEALNPGLLKKWHLHYPSVKLVNMYGITETTVHVTYKEIGKEEIESGVSNIGKPIPTLNLYILDEHQQLVPEGVVGELVVGGLGVTRGYLNRADLTRERFIQSPFNPAERLYRSGDLGVRLSTGEVVYKGRKDAQVKVRGYRIELGEIESALIKHTSIEDAVVLARADKEGVNQLAAYLISKETLNSSQLRDYLLSLLPDYMVPSYFVRLDKFPLTSNGKVDRKALPAPEHQGIESGTSYAAPRNPLEEQLTAIWQEILGKDKIGINDNFFEMGGHSLRATQLASRIFKQYNVKIELRNIFSNPTIQELAALIESFSHTTYESIPKAEELEYYSLSHAQKRMWVLDQLEENQGAYNLPGAYVLKGELDVEALQKSFETLVDRHESLRTTFIVKDGEPKQKIHSEAANAFKFEFIDLSKQTDKESTAQRLAQEEAYHIFDLSEGPLLRAKLLRLEDSKFVFLFTMHHIISDGWSMEVLIKEIITFYNAFKKGQNNPLAPLRIQYKDYAAWQRLQLEGENLIRHRSYWLSQFEGEIPVLELPTDYARPVVKTYNGKMVSSILDKETSHRLEQLSKQYGASMFMILLASLKALLYRYTGQEDIILGSPIAGRNHTDLENQIGFFVNMLPIRTQLTGKERFDNLLEKVKKSTLSAYEHQIYPFDKLVDELQLKRDMSRAALYDTGFTWHSSTNIVSDEDTDFQIEAYPLSYNIAKSDLWLYGSKMGEEIYLSFEYNTDLFTGQRIEQLLVHYKTLLSSIARDCKTPIAFLEYLSSEEKQQLLKVNNNIKLNFPKDYTLQSLFEDQVKRNPESIAIRFAGKSHTYSELNAQANQLAHCLRSRFDIKSDDLVALLVERSEQMVVGVLGILKSGAAYVPIDPSYPQERISYMLEDTSAKALVLENAADASAYGFDKTKVVLLDELSLSPYSKANLQSVNTPSDLAYIIYTSGSTGQPKGVMVEHGNVVRLLFNEEFQFDFSDKDVWTLFHSICFDFSVWELFGALLYGGTLVVVAKSIAQDPDKFADLLEEEQVTVLNQIPTMFNNLVSEVLSRGESDLKLRYVIFGGEALNPGLLKKWHLHYPSVKLVNMYGITETTVHVTYKEIGKEEIESGVSNIGKPVPTLNLYILDENQQLVPEGVVGELVVGGLGVTRGYLNRADLTRERFIQSPFNPAERLYRSGDLGVRLSTGEVVYKGRKDAQVKVRGYRIELGEIESALIKHISIEDAVVLARADKEGVNQLAAYLISKETLNSSQLRDYLLTLLPDYMVPSYFVRLDKFPLTSNGKVDRKALPAPEHQGIESGTSYAAPRNILEEQLTSIWQEILGKDKIGVEDNFFSMGGDSIRAIRLVTHVNQVLNTDLEVKDIFIHQDISALARYLQKEDFQLRTQSLKEASKAIDNIRIQILDTPELSAQLPKDWEDIYPMSDIEKGMIYHSLLSSEEGVYHDQMYHQIEDQDFNYAVFKKAILLLVQKHQILRTSFHLTGFGQEMQVVHQLAEFNADLLYEDLTDRDASMQKSYLEDYLRADREHPLEITRSGLWRMLIFKLKEAEYGILFICHHAIIDGWSDASLMTELSNIYYKLKTDDNYKPKALKATYKDYIIDQYRYKHSEEIKSFWQQYLAGYERTPLPLHKSIHNSDETESLTYSFSIEPKLREAIKELSDSRKISIKNICFAAFNYLIRFTTNQNEIMVGLVTSGRPEVADGDKILGCFLNTIPFRLQLSPGIKGNGLLEQVNSLSNELKAYDKLSLIEIVSAIGEETTGENPLFDILFGYVDFHIYNQSHEDTVNKSALISGQVKTNTIFDFVINSTSESINVLISYRQDLYSKGEIERLAGYYTAILEHIIYEGNNPLYSGSLMKEEEKASILDVINDTTTLYPKYKTIHELFEIQATKTPDAEAVVFGNTTLTYAELNEKANALAHFLRSNYSIAPDTRIGLLMERSEWMVIGIFGVLKSGAAYVPVDPSFPHERINYMLNDTAITTLLTQSYYEGEFDQINLKERWTDIASQSNGSPGKTNNSSDLAYIMYTSGSTGKPKGVAVEHKGVVRLVKDSNYVSIKPNDQVLQLSNYVFDGSVYDIFGALLNGATLHVIDKEVVLSNELLVSYINTHKVNNMFVTTALFNNIADLSPECISNFDKLYFGGETCSMSSIRKALPYRKNKDSIVHVYGPTESTTFSTYYIIGDVPEQAQTIPIGKPLSNTTVYILDSEMNTVPEGVIGEIFIGGEGLARGYWQLEELTREKFTYHYFNGGEKIRLYHTGDLGRFLPDGNIEFTGRRDAQIKLRGYRIELGEIEHAITSYGNIEQVLVLDRADKTGEKQLIAYYTTHGGERIADLREYLKDHLPDYMIPAHFIHVLDFPLNINGKINRKALPDPDQFSLEEGAEYVAPRNETEYQLAKIWSEVLGKKSIGIYDNFFEAGGHSLKATQLMSRIHKVFNVKLDVKKIFASPTIEGLAQAIRQAEQNNYEAIEAIPLQEYYDVSHAQKRLWILDQLEEGLIAYNIPYSFIFEGNLNLNAFQKAIETIVERHEILRTTFIKVKSEPKQKIWDYAQSRFKLDFEDLSAQKSREAIAEKPSYEEAVKPFDLTKALIRVKLVRLEDQKYLFLFTLHHIISDGWSMQVLINEILNLYNAYTQDKENPLAPLKIQYKDYSAWQNRQLHENLKDHQEYWMNQFVNDVPTLELHTDYPRPAVKTYNGSVENYNIDEDLTKGIKQLSLHHETSLFMTLLGFINVLLNRYTGQEDIVIGSPIAGRNHPDLENQVGFYANTLALRTQLFNNESFVDLLHCVKETTLGAYQHQVYPFDRLVDDLNVQIDKSRSPLFDVMLVLQNIQANPGTMAYMDGIEVSRLESDLINSKFDLLFTFNESNDELIMSLEYNTDLFKRETVQEIMNNFNALLRIVIQNPQVKISEIQLQTEEEEKESNDFLLSIKM